MSDAEDRARERRRRADADPMTRLATLTERVRRASACPMAHHGTTVGMLVGVEAQCLACGITRLPFLHRLHLMAYVGDEDARRIEGGWDDDCGCGAEDTAGKHERGAHIDGLPWRQESRVRIAPVGSGRLLTIHDQWGRLAATIAATGYLLAARTSHFEPVEFTMLTALGRFVDDPTDERESTWLSYAPVMGDRIKARHLPHLVYMGDPQAVVACGLASALVTDGEIAEAVRKRLTPWVLRDGEGPLPAPKIPKWPTVIREALRRDVVPTGHRDWEPWHLRGLT